jgi:hypothetical protein
LPDTPSITIVKRFTYRATPEEFSNTYHFSGTTPVDRAAWKTLADAIIAAEKLTVASVVSFVGAYGYEAGNDSSVAQIDYDVAPDAPAVTGTFSTTEPKLPGDTAATTRWWTGASSRGKKIYCRKYWHAVYANPGASGDQLLTAQKTAFDTFAAKLIDGTLPGGFKYCGPQGAVLQAPVTNTFITTRTLKRRGKRPPTSP